MLADSEVSLDVRESAWTPRSSGSTGMADAGLEAVCTDVFLSMGSAVLAGEAGVDRDAAASKGSASLNVGVIAPIALARAVDLVVPSIKAILHIRQSTSTAILVKCSPPYDDSTCRPTTHIEPRCRSPARPPTRPLANSVATRKEPRTGTRAHRYTPPLAERLHGLGWR